MMLFSSLSRARPSWLALLLSLPLIDLVSAQTWTKCNPTQGTCPADTALGMTINVDFTKGGVNSFAAAGTPTYDSNGVSFTVARAGDAPQLDSLFYIMFGRVDIMMKAAPGAGIVSSVVLQSDDLDEIDMEWLGASPDQMQTNYFGKGQTTTYNRGQFHTVQGTQTNWIRYSVDWNQDRIVWAAGNTILRTLTREAAEPNQYPQTPMQIKFGSWAGGDPGNNSPGTVQWAMGPTDYSKGPFRMMVQSIRITDYSTGHEYVYSDTSGSWQSIRSQGGSINGNANGKAGIANPAPTPTATAPAPARASASAPGIFIPVPVGGIGRDGSSATATQTGWPWVASASPVNGAIPSGWHMTSEGKIMRNASASTAIPLALLLLGSFVAGVLMLIV